MRKWLALLLGLHGLRVQEVARLTCGDLRGADGGRLQVKTLKGGRRRRVGLGPGMLAALLAEAGGRPADAPLLVTSRGRQYEELL